MTILHQASAVSIAGRAVLIEGEPGSGKSSLVLALLDRGAILIGDDGVALDPENSCLLASPAPAIAGLLEIRNIGLVQRETVSHVPVALVIRLDPQAPRFIDAAERINRAGIDLPLVRLWPESPVLHLRAEAALARYGAF